MKNLPLNEKHLADKLQNVPVPDVDQSWEQMRRLLDRDMPEPVAGAWSGNRKWWWMGITAAVVMVAAWLANPFRESGYVRGDVSVSYVSKEESVKRVAEGSNVDVVIKKSNQSSEKQIIAKEIFTQNTVASKSQSKSKPKPPAKFAQGEAGPINRLQSYQPNTKINSAIDLENTQSSETKSSEIEPSSINLTLASAENTNPSDAFIELKNNQPSHLAIAGKTDRAFAREVRQKSMKDDNRRLSRASMRGKSGDNEHELTFAAGLALPQSFAIGGQQSANYNIAAKTSRIADYLPAPFFQYHLNDKVFLQTEFHFQSPQYTQRLLLSQSVDSFATARHETSQHLEKLYYFNIPFNIYYSPVRNFYVGGGLQYSSLLGGVATYEDKRTEGSNVVSYTAVTTRFKDDSAAAVFRPSEWRYQFDANYYFNRFSIGMRYNKSMNDFINMQVGRNAVVGRNSSFLLYLRFNIWEERKKTND